MERSIFFLYEFMLLLLGVIIFVILFVTILTVLKEISIFQRATAVIVAVCVSVLSIIGLARFFIVSEATCETTTNGCEMNVDFILLPYVALALTVMLVFLARHTSGMFRNHRENKPPREISHRMR